jgi:hypothetical protein
MKQKAGFPDINRAVPEGRFGKVRLIPENNVIIIQVMEAA